MMSFVLLTFVVHLKEDSRKVTIVEKDNNFDACRDMSGRRLRHANADKRLEEWRDGDGEEDRKLEKVDEDFLKKHIKKLKICYGETDFISVRTLRRRLNEICKKRRKNESG
ncbi:uncharacterized protein LOC131656195 isoform X1 [Vicia villosa]|uniref:uncharacterized protein LOC131656195 isoform X1 n=1 Tax=Vicia villosa TaxID=3911 RepID=UPI00273B35B3|nr:uncharacterized protein LOC131656195 isoform X1 [Vicia villosa]